MTTVVGLDLSLTASGVVCWPAGVAAALDTVTDRSGRAKLDGLPRLQHIRRAVASAAATATLVVVEGLQPAGGKGSAYANERAGLYWLVLDRLAGIGIPYAVCQSGTLKTYALGVGGGVKATKAAVVGAVVRRYDLSPADDNQADAAVLAAMGLDWLGAAPAVVPQTHRRALAAVTWPGTPELVLGCRRPG